MGNARPTAQKEGDWQPAAMTVTATRTQKLADSLLIALAPGLVVIVCHQHTSHPIYLAVVPSPVFVISHCRIQITIRFSFCVPFRSVRR